MPTLRLQIRHLRRRWRVPPRRPLARRLGWQVPDSLGLRLSLWLATQTFTGLALVSLAVYLLTTASLEERQRELLNEHRERLATIATEDGPFADAASMHRRLDEFMVTRRDLRIELRSGMQEGHRRADGDGDGDGDDHALLYRAGAAPPAPAELRRIVVDLPPLRTGQAGPTRADLRLDVSRDAAFVRRLGLTLMAASLVGALLVSAGSFVLVRLALTPMRSLVAQTRRLAADTLHERLDGSAQPTELQPLVQQFNALLERLRRSYAQLEGFNADVAHELRTPLATLITGTELAMRQPGLPAAALDQLGSHLEELRRMAGIVNDMLFLSHADSGALARRQPVASLAEVARDVAEYHEAAIAEAGLEMRIDGDAAGQFDTSLLKRAISNLLGNATRYAEPGSTLRLCIDDDGAGQVRLSVVNRGPAIDADDLPRLFDRFYRADRARSRGLEHHGLGLSIVAAIARMHGGAPFAASANGETGVGVTLATVVHAPRQAPAAPRRRSLRLRRRA